MHFWEHKEVNLISLAILFPLLQWRKIHNIVLQIKKTLIVWTFWSWIPWICESKMEVPTFAWMYIVIGACVLWLSQNNMFWVCPITDHVLDTNTCILSFVSKCHLALAAVNMNMLISTCMYNFVRPLTIHLLFCNG